MKSSFEKLTNLQQRVIAGVIGAGIIGPAILWNEYSYLAANILIVSLGLREFFRITLDKRDNALRLYGFGLATFLNILTFFVQKGTVDSSWLITLLPIILLAYTIKLYDKRQEQPFQPVSFLFTALIYVGLPFYLMHKIYFELSAGYLLGFILLNWGNDIGAYFAGRFLGKHKLFPSVSPKKTWEGFAGGVILTLVASSVFSTLLIEISLTNWLIIGVLISLGATIGDLVESMLKRSKSIKDTGTLLPGHGGILDRIDSLVFVIPIVAAYLNIILK